MKAKPAPNAGAGSVLLTAVVIAALLAVPSLAAANSAAEPASPSPEESKTITGSMAPDVDQITWLTDEDSGRRYQIQRLPKIEGTYRWMNEFQVRFPGGSFFEVVDHDEDWFQVKVYERVRPEAPAKPVKKGPSEEEKTAVIESYVIEIDQVNRLQLRPFDEGLPKSGQWRNGFDVADMNNDGHKDIIFGPARKGRNVPHIFLGDSAGNWSSWKSARFPAQPYDYGDAKVADFNDDGRPDIAFGIHLRGLLVLVSDGKGGFAEWSDGIELDVPGQGGDASAFSSRAIEAFDWNRDGKTDLVALGEGPKGMKSRKGAPGGRMINTSRGFRIYLNQGDGTWQNLDLERVEASKANFGDDFAIADLDGNSFPDLLSSSGRLGNTYIVAYPGIEGLLDYREVPPMRKKSTVGGVEILDVNGDGRQDLVVGYRGHEMNVWRSGVDVYLQTATGEWQRKGLMSVENRDGVSAIAAGDVDGDGNQDLAALSAGNLWLFLGDGKGGFQFEKSEEMPELQEGCSGFDIHIVDLNGDDKGEIVAGFAGEVTGYQGCLASVARAVRGKVACVPGRRALQATEVLHFFAQT